MLLQIGLQAGNFVGVVWLPGNKSIYLGKITIGNDRDYVVNNDGRIRLSTRLVAELGRFSNDFSIKVDGVYILVETI